MASKKRQQPISLDRVRRMEREYQEAPYEFDPEDQPPPEAKPHHFAVNGFNQESLEELRDDVDSVILEPEENQDIEPFVRQQIGYRMINWHRNMGDPVYYVGSTYFSEKGAFQVYPDLEVLQRAMTHIEKDLHSDRYDEECQEELEVIAQWLGWELERSKMVSNPRQNHGNVTVVMVEFVDGTMHEVNDSVELRELEHEHGRFSRAALRTGRSSQKAFWGEWSRRANWPRTIEDVEAWFDSMEHFDDSTLAAVNRVWKQAPRQSMRPRHENGSRPEA